MQETGIQWSTGEKLGYSGVHVRNWDIMEYRCETGIKWSTGEKLVYIGVQVRNWDTVEYR
jgi:hypothetical protein